MRAFISVNLNPVIYEQIAGLQKELSNSARGIRWTKPENCHLTLKFLGDYPEDKLSVLGEVLDPVAEKFSPFPLELGTIGFFPPHGALSILWLGTKKGESVLKALEMEIGQALEKAGIDFDRKSFVPHLTIGRAQKDQKVYLNSKSVPSLFTFETLTVDAFFVMQSTLQPGGPVYTPRLRFPFASDK